MIICDRCDTSVEKITPSKLDIELSARILKSTLTRKYKKLSLVLCEGCMQGVLCYLNEPGINEAIERLVKQGGTNAQSENVDGD